MNSLEHFNNYFAKTTEATFEPSLLEFFNSVVSARIEHSARILDLGAGSKSIFEEANVEKGNVEAIDFSPKALERIPKNSGIHYQLGDITKPSTFSGNTYDLVFDSHCLHCIEGEADRREAFANIFHSLKDRGVFAAEMMVQSGKAKVFMPYKYVPEAYALEREILSFGFKIEYFMIAPGLIFSNEHGRCDVLRVIARK